MEEIISNLGFPIASVVGLAYYFAQFVSDVNAKSNNSKSLEIVENIDMKSMLHLALLEIKN